MGGEGGQGVRTPLKNHKNIGTEQNRTDYLFDVNYTVSSQSNTIIILYISRSQILLKCLNQVVVII